MTITCTNITLINEQAYCTKSSVKGLGCIGSLAQSGQSSDRCASVMKACEVDSVGQTCVKNHCPDVDREQQTIDNKQYGWYTNMDQLSECIRKVSAPQQPIDISTTATIPATIPSKPRDSASQRLTSTHIIAIAVSCGVISIGLVVVAVLVYRRKHKIRRSNTLSSFEYGSLRTSRGSN